MGKTEHTRIEALDALLAEKRKHEGYLAKLEEKRAGTPEHVFARLRDEYLTKLTDLQVRAAAEAEALTESLQEDEAAVAEIEARLAAVTEERVEGELRAEVGEYDPKEWAKKLETLTASSAKIEKERDLRVASFERTRALLVEAKGADAVAALSAPPAPPAPPPAPRSPTPAAAPAVTRAPAPPAAPAARATPAVPAAAAEPVVRATGAAAVAPPAPPAPKPTPAKGAPMAGGPSFDELAFLNSVVGRTSVPMKVDGAPPPPRPSRPVAEVKDAAAPPAAKSTVAPQVPPSPAPAPSQGKGAPAAEEDEDEAPPSALGKPTPRSSQAIKTLKCQECGTLNYPTEWYCERCGGELAAL